MAFLQVQNIRIAGISAGVPKHVENNLMNTSISTEYSPVDFVRQTGVKERRIGNKTALDLCLPAAEQLITDLGWKKTDIDVLVFCTQMSDYFSPANSCIVQGMLGLDKECFAMDINLGCSGWVYGISTVASLLSKNGMKRALFCCGDGKRRAQYDNPLFGFAGTVTALEYCDGAGSLNFHLGTDGKNYDAIIIPDGGSRNPINNQSFIPHLFEGKMIMPCEPHMKGMDVFGFGFSTAPKSVKSLISRFGLSLEEIDYFVFHQANMQMNNLIVKKLKIDTNKVPSCMSHFGNTSSASIPLTIVTQLREKNKSKNKLFLCCGFGVGLSWGTVTFKTDNEFIVSNLVEI